LWLDKAWRGKGRKRRGKKVWRKRESGEVQDVDERHKECGEGREEKKLEWKRAED
jgi:hypothetical protein